MSVTSSPILADERLIYKVGGVVPANALDDYTWHCSRSICSASSLLGSIFQKALPLNPQGIDNVPFALALNTAVSFMTNTNWQAYSGENTMSYLTQMAGLAVQNFASAATGIAVVMALARGLTRRSEVAVGNREVGGRASAGESIGNFWADSCVRFTYCCRSRSSAVVLVQQGAADVRAYKTVEIIDRGTGAKLDDGPAEGRAGNAVTEERLHRAGDPAGAASQIAIKQLGTNGGGFYGVSSASVREPRR